MVGTGSPVSFRRRPPLALRGGPDCQSSATVFTPVWAHVSAWGPARHDNHEGQRMTPGAPTDGARSRFPGHRGSTEAGTILKDSGKRRRSSKGVHCGPPLIDEAGAQERPDRSFALPRLCREVQAPFRFRRARCHFSGTQRGPQAFACGPLPQGARYSVPPEGFAPSDCSRIGHSSAVCAPASSIEALGSTVITASALRVR